MLPGGGGGGGGGHLSVVKMLVSQHNVDVNARNDQNQLSLHVAASRGHTKLVKAFINDFDCNPNEKGLEGRTILRGVARILEKKGQDCA